MSSPPPPDAEPGSLAEREAAAERAKVSQAQLADWHRAAHEKGGKGFVPAPVFVASTPEMPLPLLLRASHKLPFAGEAVHPHTTTSNTPPMA